MDFQNNNFQYDHLSNQEHLYSSSSQEQFNSVYNGNSFQNSNSNNLRESQSQGQQIEQNSLKNRHLNHESLSQEEAKEQQLEDRSHPSGLNDVLIENNSNQDFQRENQNSMMQMINNKITNEEGQSSKENNSTLNQQNKIQITQSENSLNNSSNCQEKPNQSYFCQGICESTSPKNTQQFFQKNNELEEEEEEERKINFNNQKNNFKELTNLQQEDEQEEEKHYYIQKPPQSSNQYYKQNQFLQKNSEDSHDASFFLNEINKQNNEQNESLKQNSTNKTSQLQIQFTKREFSYYEQNQQQQFENAQKKKEKKKYQQQIQQKLKQNGLNLESNNKYDYEFSQQIFKYFQELKNNKFNYYQDFFADKQEYSEYLEHLLFQNENKHKLNQRGRIKFDFETDKITFDEDEEGFIVYGYSNCLNEIQNYLRNHLILFVNKSSNFGTTAKILHYSKNHNPQKSDESFQNDSQEIEITEKKTQTKNRFPFFYLKLKIDLDKNNYQKVFDLLLSNENIKDLQAYLIPIQNRELKNNFYALKQHSNDQSNSYLIQKIIKSARSLQNDLNLEDKADSHYPEYSFLDEFNQKLVYFNQIKVQVNNLQNEDLKEDLKQCLIFILTNKIALIQNTTIIQSRKNEKKEKNKDNRNNRNNTNKKNDQKKEEQQVNSNNNKYNLLIQFEALKILINFYSRQETKKPILIICPSKETLDLYKFELIRLQDIYNLTSQFMGSEKTLQIEDLDSYAEKILADKLKNPQNHTLNSQQIHGLKNKFSNLSQKQPLIKRIFQIEKIEKFQQNFNQRFPSLKIDFEEKITEILIREYFQEIQPEVKQKILNNRRLIFESWCRLELNSKNLQDLTQIQLNESQKKIIDYNYNRLLETKKCYMINFQSQESNQIVLKPTILNLQGVEIDNTPESFCEFLNSFEKLSQINFYYMMSFLEYSTYFYINNKLIEDFQICMEQINQAKTQKKYLDLYEKDVILTTVGDSLQYYQTLMNIKPEIIIVDESIDTNEEYQVSDIIHQLQPKHLIYFGDFYQFQSTKIKIESSIYLQIEKRNNISLFQRLVKFEFPFYNRVQRIKSKNQELKILADYLLNNDINDSTQEEENKQIIYYSNQFEKPEKQVIIIKSKQYTFSEIEQRINNLAYHQQIESSYEDYQSILKEKVSQIQNIYYQKKVNQQSESISYYLAITLSLEKDIQEDRKPLSFCLKLNNKYKNYFNDPDLLAYLATFLDNKVSKSLNRYIKLNYNPNFFSKKRYSQNQQIQNPKLENSDQLNTSSTESSQTQKSNDQINDLEIIQKDVSEKQQLNQDQQLEPRKVLQMQEDLCQKPQQNSQSSNSSTEIIIQDNNNLNQLPIQKQKLEQKLQELNNCRNNQQIDESISKQQENLNKEQSKLTERDGQDSSESKDKEVEDQSKLTRNNLIKNNNQKNIQILQDIDLESNQYSSADREDEEEEVLDKIFNDTKSMLNNILDKNQKSQLMQNLQELEQNLEKLIKTQHKIDSEYLLKNIDYILWSIFNSKDHNLQFLKDLISKEFTSFKIQQKRSDLIQLQQKVLQAHCNLKFEESTILQNEDENGIMKDQLNDILCTQIFNNDQINLKKLQNLSIYQTEIIDQQQILLQILLQNFKFVRVLKNASNLSIKIKLKKGNFDKFLLSCNSVDQKQVEKIKQDIQSYLCQKYETSFYILYLFNCFWGFEKVNYKINQELKKIEQFEKFFILISKKKKQSKSNNNLECKSDTDEFKSKILKTISIVTQLFGE